METVSKQRKSFPQEFSDVFKYLASSNHQTKSQRHFIKNCI